MGEGPYLDIHSGPRSETGTGSSVGRGPLRSFTPGSAFEHLLRQARWGMENSVLPDTGAPGESPSALFSAGLGLGLGWDLIRLDLVRGFTEGGTWELVVSVNPDFWPWL